MSAAGAPASSSAGVAGTGQSDGNGGAQQTDAQQGQQEQAGPIDGLARQLAEVTESQEGLRKFLTSQPWGQEGEAPDGDGELDLGFDDDDGYERPASLDLDGDPEQFMAQLDAATGEAVQEAMAPVVQHVNQQLAKAHERIAEQRRETEMRDLAEEFPELQDREAAEAAFEQAGAIAQVLGQPALGAEPQFVRIVHAAAKMYALAAEENGRDAPPSAHLEGGGGANPGPRQPTAADRILNPGGKRGASVLEGI